MVVAVLLLSVPADAYREYQSELVAGDMIIQDQMFRSLTTQNLFHRTGEADRDIEAFALTGTPGGGVASSQAASIASEGFEEGYFDSTATSTMIPPAPIGMGFLGTTIGDPINSGTMLGSGVLFPSMALNEPTAPPQISPTTAETETQASEGKKGKLELVDIIKPASGNISAPANATKKDKKSKKSNDTLIKSGNTFSRQPYRPFIMALSYPASPVKTPRDKVANMSAWDRFRMNVIGRSTTDKGYNGSTSYPLEITPWNSISPLKPDEFMTNSSMMTAQGTVLSNRQWPL